MKKFTIGSIALLAFTLHAANVLGHGFGVSVDNSSNPTEMSASFSEPVLDDADSTIPSNAPYPTAGPANLFLDAFDTPNADGSYGTVEGFAQTAGPFPLNYTATFNILSPLYFSDGTRPAVPASLGTYVHIYDLYADDPDYPGASFGDVYLSGTTSFLTGFGVSLYYYHELEKDIYLADGSAQTYGEYGFAFDVVVHFGDFNKTLDTGPLYDVFALDIPTDSDPDGGFATYAPFALQDAATEEIYDALVPEPSAFLLAMIGGGLLIAHRLRRKPHRA